MSQKLERKFNIMLENSSYPVLIGSRLYSTFESFGIAKSQRVLIVTNDRIAALYLEPVIKTLRSNQIDADYFLVPDGEAHKTVDNWQRILETLLEKQYTRHSILLALGGGVIGDLAGFAAATYQRGIKYIQLPTTLLSQIDSSVGGKTAVNHPLGKNMIGAFHQPDRVIIDIETLKTLSDREFSAGLAEVIKYGIILDYQFFIWLENNFDKLLEKDETILVKCISRCCQLKAQIIKQDEHEHHIRALLNFGHTFGHAIEALTGFNHWLHGEAIAVGMLMAAQTSLFLGLLDTHDFQRIKSLLKRANLPITRPKGFVDTDYLPFMKRDKKRMTTSLRLVLANRLGKAKIKEISDETILLKAIQCI